MGRNKSGDASSDKLSKSEIEELVGNITARSSERRNRNDGGSAREKYSCKCCGTRVDTGQHKCSMCQEAGCSMGERKCRFY